jgi:hypothetical protein
MDNDNKEMHDAKRFCRSIRVTVLNFLALATAIGAGYAVERNKNN